jgi:Ser/Thr protein kinase RdoA (MazF antagonist)
MFDLEDLQDHFSLCYQIRTTKVALLSANLNYVYRVIAADKDYVLKIYHSRLWTEDEVESECRVAEFLKFNFIDVSLPIRSATSKFASQLRHAGSNYTAAVFEYIKGTPMTSGNEKQLQQLGKIVARLHVACDRCPFIDEIKRPTHNTRTLIARPIKTISDRFPLTAKQGALLERVRRTLTRAICSLEPTPTAFGLCHGDIQPRHAIVQEDEDIVLIDTECIYLGWRLFDFASLIRSTGGFGRNWNSFVAGYTSICPLGAHEMSLIPSFCIARTLSEIEVMINHEQNNDSRMTHRRLLREFEFMDLLLHQHF